MAGDAQAFAQVFDRYAPASTPLPPGAGATTTPRPTPPRVAASDIWLALMKQAPSDESLYLFYASHIQNGGSQGAMLLMPTHGYPE